MRHIFRIPNEKQKDYFSNQQDSNSLSRGTKRVLHDWNTLSSIQRNDSHQRNYALFIRTLTPKLAAFEVMENNANFTKKEVKNALLLASHAHSPRHRSTSNATRLNKSKEQENHHLRIPFCFWIAYWTKGSNSRFVTIYPIGTKPNLELGELSRHSGHDMLSNLSLGRS